MGRRRARALVLGPLVVVLAAALPSGARTQVLEKDANLAISRMVAAGLREAGVRVTMTRTDDRTLDHVRRTLVPPRTDAFVSIHNNASYSRSVQGSQVYHSIRRDGSAALGAAIHGAIGRAFEPGRRNDLLTRRGCCGDYYFQLRLPRAPAVIVEGAFLSNPAEARMLDTREGRRRIARAVTRGILDWQRSFSPAPPPRLEPGTRVTGPIPPPLDGRARAFGSRAVQVRFDAHDLADTWRIYRGGRLIAARDASGRTVRFTDHWVGPGQRYTYRVHAARAAADGTWIESAPLELRVRTPGIAVVIDPGHGGRDPGAVGRY